MEAYIFQQVPASGMTDTSNILTAPTKTREPKAATLGEADWVPYKNRIIQLHITEHLPLKDLRTIMRMGRWKLNKNVKPKEMKAIVKKSQHRDFVETQRRSLRFTNNIAKDQIYEPSSRDSPSAVAYSTVSEPEIPNLGAPPSLDRTPTQTPILEPMRSGSPLTIAFADPRWRLSASVSPAPPSLADTRSSTPDTAPMDDADQATMQSMELDRDPFEPWDRTRTPSI
ncbi:hypothetical protein E8E11_002186 [Didymella keratinophila]|nr:hypothetical protein E8E11_002186 [Didymella keratinophila]